MATIGNIVTNFGINTADFERGLNRADRKLGSTQSNMNKHLARAEKRFQSFRRVATGAVGAVVGGAGLAVLTQKVSQAATSIDELNRAAKRMGTSAKGVKAVQKALKDLGVQTNQANDLIQELQIRLGEAADGGGPAADMVKELGLNLEQLTKLPADKQMAAIVRELRGMEDATRQAAVASAFFSDEGVQPIIDLANRGEGALRKARKEVELFGTAVEGAAANKVTAMIRSIQNLRSVLGGWIKQLTVAVAPAVKRVADALTENLAGAMQAMKGRSKDLSADMLNRMESIATAAAYVGDAFWGWEAIFAGLQSVWFRLSASLLKAMEKMTNGIETAINRVIGGVNRVQRAIGNLPGIQAAIVDKVDLGGDLFGGMFEEASKDVRRFDKNLEETVNSLTATEQVTRFFADLRDQAGKAGDTMGKVSDAAKKGSAAIRDKTKAVAESAKATAKANEGNETMIPAMEPIKFIPEAA